MNGFFVCTICSAKKRSDKGLLPAIKRYQSRRIQHAYQLSQQLGQGFLILSGEYGLLEPKAPIPNYDHLLRLEEVEALVPRLVKQFQKYGVREVLFVAEPRTAENWEAYYQALEQACKALAIPIQYQILS